MFIIICLHRHDALFALRCLLAQKKFPKKYKKIMELQSHTESKKPNTDVYKYKMIFIRNSLFF